MSIHDTGINHPDMSNAISLAQTLERRERTRLGCRDVARRSLASKLRIGVGSFENLVRGRVKRVDATIRDRLQALVIKELELEILRLQHELAIATQSSSRPDDDEIFEVETHLTQARTALNRIVSGKGKRHESADGRQLQDSR